MKMNDSVFMGFDNLGREKNSFCDILADFACHVITLGRSKCCIFIGIFFFQFFIAVFNQTHDRIIRCV